MKKSLLVGLLAMLLVAGLAAGCSSGTGSSTSTTKAATPAAAAAQPTQAPVATAVPAARNAPAANIATAAPAVKNAPATSVASAAGSPSQAVADAPMPANPARYDKVRAVKIGEAVQLAGSGLIFQVTGVRTVEDDARSEFVIADVVVGNAGKETAPISSLMLFGIVADGWHWYGVDLESIPRMVALKLPQPFDAEIAAGKAAKGSLPIRVPKDATGLTLAFQGMALLSDDQTVFVPLGIRGEGTLPLAPAGAADVVKGKTYKVGEAFTAPKRGLVVKVNGYWERTESAREAKLGPGEKFVLVDLTAAPAVTGKGLRRYAEIALVTADGKKIHQTDKDGDVYLAESVSADSGLGRGVALFRVAKSASGLKLSFDPLDPSSSGFIFGSGERLAGEQAFVDLSGGLAKVPAILRALPTAAPTATAKPPVAGDPASVPAELKAIPAPPGFMVVKDSAHRYPDAGKVETASVSYAGKGDIQSVKDFFKKNLTEAAGFEFVDEDLSSSGPDEGDLTFSYTTNEAGYGLSINIENKGGNLLIQLYMEGG
ncbi:MAG TPA: hypothetical protein VGA61_01830 [Anaerolineae bacterium]